MVQLSDIQQGLLCCTIFVVIRAMFRDCDRNESSRQLNAIFVDNSMAIGTWPRTRLQEVFSFEFCLRGSR